MRNLFKELEKNKIKQLTKINTGNKKKTILLYNYNYTNTTTKYSTSKCFLTIKAVMEMFNFLNHFNKPSGKEKEFLFEKYVPNKKTGLF